MADLEEEGALRRIIVGNRQQLKWVAMPRILHNRQEFLERRWCCGYHRPKAAAIKRAVAETTKMDHARMKLIVLAQIETTHPYYYSDDKDINWFLKKLNVKPIRSEYQTTDAVKTKVALIQAVDRLPEQDLAKVIVEFMLTKLTFKGDIKEYKILTTEPLRWMGIAAQSVG